MFKALLKVIPLSSVYRPPSAAESLLTSLGFLIQKLWTRALSVAGGQAVLHSEDKMQLPLPPSARACRPR